MQKNVLIYSATDKHVCVKMSQQSNVHVQSQFDIFIQDT